MIDDPVEGLPYLPHWGQQAIENAIVALRWALLEGDLSSDDRTRARRGLEALEA